MCQHEMILCDLSCHSMPRLGAVSGHPVLTRDIIRLISCQHEMTYQVGNFQEKACLYAYIQIVVWYRTSLSSSIIADYVADVKQLNSFTGVISNEFEN